MKSLKSYIAVLSLVLAGSSCVNEDIIEQKQTTAGEFTVKVEFGSGSRTMFPSEDARTQVWSAGDKVLVYGEKAKGILTLKEGAGLNAATFSGTVYGDPSRLKYVVYPADHATLKNGKVTFNYDAADNSVEYPNSNLPMWGAYDATSVKLHNLAGSIRVKVKDIPEDATLLLRARGLAGKAEFIPEEGKIKPLAYNELDADNMVPYKDVAVTGIPAGAEFIDVPVFIGNPNADGKEKRPLAIYLNGKKLTGSVPSVTTKVGAVSSSEVPEMIWNATTESLTRISTLDEDSEPEEVEENTDPAKDYDYLITSAEELLWFAENAAQMAGKVVKLGASIDLDNQPWTPISGFKGTFDGAEFTISNLNVAVTGKASAGLFADAQATIKNLYLKDVNISGNYKAGAIVGDGLCAKIENCHVIGGTITSTPYNNDDANHVGGIVGFLSAEPNAYVKDCTVDGLTITAYRDVAGIAGTACRKELDVINCTVSNTTIIADQTAEYAEVKAANAGEIVGRNFKNVELTGNTVGEGVSVGTLVATAAQLKAALADNSVTQIILGADIIDHVVMTSNKTIDGRDYQLGSINLNGAKNVTLKNITFDGANAVAGCDGKGKLKQYANIVTGVKDNNPKEGALNLVIDDCKFIGKLANGGVSIAFTDQNRGSGQSGNITIKNSIFETEGAYYYIYGHYFGKEEMVIDNNAFKTKVQGVSIYLGRYQSSVPVVVKYNDFQCETNLEEAVALQAHSESYTVSINASNNTFKK